MTMVCNYTAADLRNAREAAGLSRDALAKKVGCHAQAIVHVENGSTRCDSATGRLIAIYFGLLQLRNTSKRREREEA